ncbi:MAG: DegV family protein [Acidimicrobiaceae bacterium]|nr:DegV family protein [Acidimicrobiaceae bacterium]
MTVGIVTDSSCDLHDDELDGIGVEIVPLFIRFGTDEFVDREQISVEDFYRRMASVEELPQTAAPPPGRFEQAFRRCLDAGCEAVVCINLSAAISATMQSAVQAVNAIEAAGESADIRVLDSRSVTAGLGTMVLQAARMAADGSSADAIEAFVADASERTHVFGTLDTLENLRKGGRIGGAQALLGSMLSIKPIVDISSGEVEEAAKQRTRRKALGWLRDTVRAAEPVEHLAVMHGEAPDVGDFCEMLAEVHSGDIRVCKVGPIVGTHAGQGVLGMAYQIPAA